MSVEKFHFLVFWTTWRIFGQCQKTLFADTTCSLWHCIFDDLIKRLLANQTVLGWMHMLLPKFVVLNERLARNFRRKETLGRVLWIICSNYVSLKRTKTNSFVEIIWENSESFQNLQHFSSKRERVPHHQNFCIFCSKSSSRHVESVSGEPMVLSLLLTHFPLSFFFAFFVEILVKFFLFAILFSENSFDVRSFRNLWRI